VNSERVPGQSNRRVSTPGFPDTALTTPGGHSRRR
jgi:hypothetical protein